MLKIKSIESDPVDFDPVDFWEGLAKMRESTNITDIDPEYAVSFRLLHL